LVAALRRATTSGRHLRRSAEAEEVVEDEAAVASLDTVGTSGASGERCAEVTASGLIWPALEVRHERGDDVDADRDHARDQVGRHRRAAAVGNVGHLDASALLIISP
jgi:hypothetical protein